MNWNPLSWISWLFKTLFGSGGHAEDNMYEKDVELGEKFVKDKKDELEQQHKIERYGTKIKSATAWCYHKIKGLRGVINADDSFNSAIKCLAQINGLQDRVTKGNLSPKKEERINIKCEALTNEAKKHIEKAKEVAIKANKAKIIAAINQIEKELDAILKIEKKELSAESRTERDQADAEAVVTQEFKNNQAEDEGESPSDRKLG